MSFGARLTRRGGLAMITLAGALDATTASAFRSEVERAAEQRVSQLILDMTDVPYLSSAGLRTLIFARQKLPEDSRIVLVGTNEAVQRTIRLVGFQYSVEFGERIPEGLADGRPGSGAG